MMKSIHGSKFCDTCLAIFSRTDEIFLDEPRSLLEQHHRTITSLQNSADRNCPICKSVWLGSVVRFGKEDWTHSEVSTKYEITHRAMTLREAVRQHRPMRLVIEVRLSTSKGSQKRILDFDLIPYAPAQHRHPKGAKATTSLQSLLKWYRACLDNHENCRSIFRGSYVPHRLLYLGESASSDSVKLVDFGEDGIVPPPAYATLSHRWGQSQPLRLLTDNIYDMKQKIPQISLPKLFSDAISVCHELDIHYLWIDSLCILQDSKEDWKQESLLMGKIYSHAMINIAATGANDSNNRLNHTKANDASVALFTWSAESAHKYIAVDDPMAWPDSFMNEPLLKRGWVMQERLLATRVIHFTGPELLWECRTLAASESYPVQLPKSLRRIHDSRNQLWQTTGQGPDPWSTLVDDYSKCELTFPGDKLIAIAGFIMAIKSLEPHRGKCWSGMWENDLPFSLLWVRLSIDETKSPKIRPDEFRAPSWAWASLDCPIWTAWADTPMKSLLVSNWEVQSLETGADSSSIDRYSISITGPLARAHVIQKGGGSLFRGIERARGFSFCINHVFYLHKAPEGMDGDVKLSSEYSRRLVSTKEKSRRFVDDRWNDAIFDDFDKENIQKSIWCAPIYTCQKDLGAVGNGEDIRTMGLLMEEVEKHVYRRLGVFSVGCVRDQKILGELTLETYTII